MFTPTKDVLKFVSSTVELEAKKVKVQIFHEHRRLAQEAVNKGVRSGLILTDLQKFYDSEINKFSDTLIDEINALQKEQDVILSSKDWKAIEDELLNGYRDIHNDYSETVEKICIGLQIQTNAVIIADFTETIKKKVAIARAKIINKRRKMFLRIVKVVGLFVPIVGTVIAILNYLRSTNFHFFSN